MKDEYSISENRPKLGIFESEDEKDPLNNKENFKWGALIYLFPVLNSRVDGVRGSRQWINKIHNGPVHYQLDKDS